MNLKDKKTIRIALLDLYEGVENQGMRCIREIIKLWGNKDDLEVVLDEFDVRLEKQLPGTNYDIYISSGGPGSPMASDDNDWEQLYFAWLNNIEHWNNNPANSHKKFVFFT